MLRPLLVWFAGCCAVSPAQELRWSLPERGGAIYRRQLQVVDVVTPTGAWTPPLWEGEQAAGLVLDGELDAARQRRAAPVGDLRELLPQLALTFAARSGGKVALAFVGGGRCQPVHVEASLQPPDAQGEQAFTATLAFDAKAARGLGAVGADAPKLAGTLRGTRVVDAARGLVLRWQGTAEFVLDYPATQDGDRKHPVRRRTVTLQDAWAEPVLVGPDDAAFQTRIADAIRSSAAHLRGQLAERVANPGAPGGDPYHDVQPGELALLLLALRRSGLDGRDEVLARGFDALRQRSIAGTYSLAVAILAFESLYTPPGEWAELRAGRLKAPLPRVLPAADLALLQGYVRELLDNVDTTTDAAYLRRWHYGPSREWDNSNTQYALLGLYAAQLCGVEVSPQVWTAAANHWLQCGEEAGDAVGAELLFHRDLARSGRTKATARTVTPRGWGYRVGEATGSMTTAAITGLTVCSSALRLARKGGPKLLGEIDEAIRGGFAWLQQHLTVRHNPGPPHVHGSWHLYYLYGLERACELNQVARLGGRDWYIEGAAQLVATQRPDGSWGGPVETAFGLLFLKKTALPAITGR